MTTSTETTITGLTKQDLKALRTAERVSFYRYDGKNEITCRKEIENPGPFDDKEKTYDITVQGTVHIYGEDAGRIFGMDANCYASAYLFSDHWRTVVSLLKVGDNLTLKWEGSDNNGYLNDMQGQKLHHDRLYLVVHRPGNVKNHKITRSQTLTFHIDDRIAPDNTARMVRPKQYSI